MRSRITDSSFKTEQWEKYYPVYPTGAPTYTHTYSRSYSSDLEVSANHHVSLLGKTRQNLGGPFLVTRRHYHESSSLGPGSHLFTHPNGYFEGVWKTPQYARKASFSNADFPLVTVTDGLELEAMGREAIAKTAPNAPEFDGSSFIGELREGLPSIVPFMQTAKSRTARARNAGDEYLNLEFGWKPLLRDFNNFTHVMQNAEALLEAYEKESGQLIHRQYSWPDIVERTESRGEGLPTPLINQTNLYEPGGYLGDLVITTTETTKRWFKAVYMYYFPKRGDKWRHTARLNKLYGLEITPNTLWNLAPWSWAADWLGDAGTLAENMSIMGRDNLVMPWAYIMETKSVKVEYQLSGIRYKSYPGEQWFRQSFETEVKSRLPASPYGFDVDWPDLSAKQLAILGALGISRSA